MKKCIQKYDSYLTFGLIFRFISFFQSTSKSKQDSAIISEKSYLDRLGIYDSNSDEGKEKIKEAYNRANHNREFEIDKFWSRAAYFWSFLAIIFAVYFTFITTETGPEKETVLSNIVEESSYIEIYIICMGLIFAFSWRYIILGSKQWQENWEKHIENLEKYVTGYLYKNIFRERKFYSVSKINLILSNVIIIVWLFILFNYCQRMNLLPNLNEEIDWKILSPIIFSGYIILQFMYGYGRTKIDKKRFINKYH